VLADEKSMRGWDVIFVLGPFAVADDALIVCDKWSAWSHGNVMAKVALGEAISRILQISGFVDWPKVFGCEVTCTPQQQ